MSETITVQISDYEIYNCKNESHCKTFVVSKLRNAGIPVIGLLDFRGVSSGALTCFDFTYKQGKLFVWNP